MGSQSYPGYVILVLKRLAAGGEDVIRLLDVTPDSELSNTLNESAAVGKGFGYLTIGSESLFKNEVILWR